MSITVGCWQAETKLRDKKIVTAMAQVVKKLLNKSLLWGALFSEAQKWACLLSEIAYCNLAEGDGGA